MGEIAVRIIAFEEAGLGLPAPSTGTILPSPDTYDERIPSEEQRIQSLEILVNKVVQRFEIRVTRYLRGVNGRLTKSVTDVPL